MHQRAALAAGEYRGIEFLFQLGIGAGENNAAAGSAQSLVRGGRDHVGVGHRVRIHARRYQTGHMGHIDHQVGANLVGNVAKARPVHDLRIGGKARDNHFRFVLQGQLFYPVVIDFTGVGIEAVLHRVVHLAGEIRRRAVREVAAVRQAHAQHGVSRRAQGHVDRRVCLGAGMGLHIGVVRTEQCLDPLDSEFLGLVHVFATAVVALARITFGIFIGQLRCPVPA